MASTIVLVNDYLEFVVCPQDNRLIEGEDNVVIFAKLRADAPSGARQAIGSTWSIPVLLTVISACPNNFGLLTLSACTNNIDRTLG
jgi:hypothetical protein